MGVSILGLAWRSLLNRRVSALLTVIAIALSVALFLGVENARNAARAGFDNTISGTDLIVGAPSGQVPEHPVQVNQAVVLERVVAGQLLGLLLRW